MYNPATHYGGVCDSNTGKFELKLTIIPPSLPSPTI